MCTNQKYDQQLGQQKLTRRGTSVILSIETASPQISLPLPFLRLLLHIHLHLLLLLRLLLLFLLCSELRHNHHQLHQNLHGHKHHRCPGRDKRHHNMLASPSRATEPAPSQQPFAFLRGLVSLSFALAWHVFLTGFRCEAMPVVHHFGGRDVTQSR